MDWLAVKKDKILKNCCKEMGLRMLGSLEVEGN